MFSRLNQQPHDRPMKNFLTWPLLTFAVVCFFGMATAQAETISPNNPFRGYSVSGINYGSQQWEKANRGQQPQSNQRSRRVVILRR